MRSLRAIAAVLPLLAVSCRTATTTPTPGQPGVPARPTYPGPTDGARADEATAFETAVGAISLANPEPARAALENFLARYPNSPARLVAEAHLARLALSTGDVAAARARIDPAAPGIDGGDRFVAFVAGLVAARSGQAQRAVALLAPFADGPPRDTPERDEAELQLHAALAEARVGAGDPGGALAAWETYADRRAREPEQAFARERADELAARLADADAIRLYEGARSDFARAALGARAAAALRARGDAGGAQRIEEATASLRRSAGFPGATRGLGPGDPQRLGLLAPFSGAAAVLGEVILRGAMLAIGDAKSDAGRPFQIVARDAAAERGLGERAAAEVVREEAAVAVVGVGDRTAAAAAAREGVPVLLLDESTPGATSTAFQVLHPPEIRAAELARRALVLGARRFAVLAPDSAGGRRLSEAFVRAIASGDGRVTAQASYPAGASAFTAPIARIKSAAFEAIFVADDAARLELIAPALAAADIWPQPYGTPAQPAAPGAAARRPVLLLSPAVGLGPQLLRNAGRYVQGALLAPGFFADADDPRTGAFVNQFRVLYGQDPGAADAYGYDAFRLLVAAINRGGKTRSDLLRSITSDAFEGVTGTVRFGPDHTRVDPPPVYTVAGDAIRVLR